MGKEGKSTGDKGRKGMKDMNIGSEKWRSGRYYFPRETKLRMNYSVPAR
jgi:hypothetical protein